jgi:hypothetical protein
MLICLYVCCTGKQQQHNLDFKEKHFRITIFEAINLILIKYIQSNQICMFIQQFAHSQIRLLLCTHIVLSFFLSFYLTRITFAHPQTWFCFQFKINIFLFKNPLYFIFKYPSVIVSFGRKILGRMLEGGETSKLAEKYFF